MKAVFFHCTIPVEIHQLNDEGKIEVLTVNRQMMQGEVVEVLAYSEGGLMEFTDGSIWWVPDKKLFNIVNAGQGNQNSCCGG